MAISDHLRDREEIRDVLARYCRAVDRGDEELLRSCYHADAVDDHGHFIGTINEFVKYVAGGAAVYDSTNHSVGNSLIVVDGDHADVETYYTGMHVLKAESDAPRRLLTSVGRYIDRFERRQSQWRIARRVVVKTFRTVTEMIEPAGDGFVLSRRDRLDPAYTGPSAVDGLERG